MFFNLICYEDINECAAETDECVVNANCNNTEGSYECICSTGYHGNGLEQCDG